MPCLTSIEPVVTKCPPAKRSSLSSDDARSLRKRVARLNRPLGYAWMKCRHDGFSMSRCAALSRTPRGGLDIPASSSRDRCLAPFDTEDIQPARTKYGLSLFGLPLIRSEALGV
jgi:hypothetical protein